MIKLTSKIFEDLEEPTEKELQTLSKADQLKTIIKYKESVLEKKLFAKMNDLKEKNVFLFFVNETEFDLEKREIALLKLAYLTELQIPYSSYERMQSNNIYHFIDRKNQLDLTKEEKLKFDIRRCVENFSIRYYLPKTEQDKYCFYY